MKEHEKTMILIFYRTWGLRSILRTLWSRENLRAPVCRQPFDTRVMQSAYNYTGAPKRGALISIVDPICSMY